MSEIEAVIKRLMKYCERANKEVTQSIERRKLVMDIEMIYSGLIEIMEQRDAALELAKKIRQQKAHTYASENADLYRGFDNGCVYVADKIEAIFAPKDGK